MVGSSFSGTVRGGSRPGAGPLGPYAVPAALLLATGVPLVAVLLLDSYHLPMDLLVAASLPAAAVLAVQRALVVPRSVVLAGAALFVAGTLISTLISDPFKLHQFETLLLRGLFIPWFMYLVALVALLERERLTLFLLVLVVACGVSAAINAGLLLTGDPRAIGDADMRLIPVVGVPRHRWPTTISATYALMLVAAFALVATPGQRPWIRIPAALAGIATAVALVLTQTRSGYLAALAGIVAVAALLSRRVLLVTLAGIVALAAVVVIYPPALDALLARGGSYRVATWLRYLAFAWEHPLVGTGLNQRLWLTVDGAELHHAHNMLISALVRGGLIGLAGMAAMLAGGLYYAWRHAVRSGNPVIFGMILALAVAGTFDYDLILTRMDWMWLTFWLPIGLAAGGELYVRELSPAGSTATMPTT